MDGSERHPGVVAKVSCMPGGLRCDWNRSRTLGVNCNVSADAACTLVRGIAVVPCSKTPAPPNPFHIPNERLTRLGREEIGEFHFEVVGIFDHLVFSVSLVAGRVLKNDWNLTDP